MRRRTARLTRLTFRHLHRRCDIRRILRTEWHSAARLRIDGRHADGVEGGEWPCLRDSTDIARRSGNVAMHPVIGRRRAWKSGASPHSGNPRLAPKSLMAAASEEDEEREGDGEDSERDADADAGFGTGG